MPLPVSRIMSVDPRTVSADDALANAERRMQEFGVRHLPVVEHGRLVGLLSLRDVLPATGLDPARTLEADGRPFAVRDAMSVSVETAAPDEDVAIAAARLGARGIGCLPVLDGQVLVGLLSEIDVLRAVAADPGLAGEDAPVADCMTVQPLTADTDDTVGAVLETCRREGVRHLPVVHDGWLAGIVSDRDLLLWEGRGRADLRVGDVMATDLVAARPGERLSVVTARLLAEGVGAVPVTDDGRVGRLLGVLSVRDVLARVAANGSEAAT